MFKKISFINLKACLNLSFSHGFSSLILNILPNKLSDNNLNIHRNRNYLISYRNCFENWWYHRNR